MNEENSKRIWTYMQEAGDKLVGKLPPSWQHPKGRNPYAHVALCVKDNFDLRPSELISMLNLKRPIYRATAAYGHFGREESAFTWEKIDKAEALKG